MEDQYRRLGIHVQDLSEFEPGFSNTQIIYRRDNSVEESDKVDANGVRRFLLEKIREYKI